MLSAYKTVTGEYSSEITEKKSRFIATLRHVETSDEATEFINEMRAKYWDATHNVYAYILIDGNIKRYSDDGEPSGTSGIPSLGVLEGEGLYNVAVVITRYFGGTLLGTGGLVRAYSGAVKNVISSSKVIERRLCKIIKCRCAYNIWGKIRNILDDGGFPVKSIDYTSVVDAVFGCREEELSSLLEKITDKTDAQAVCTVCGEEYIDIECFKSV